MMKSLVLISTQIAIVAILVCCNPAEEVELPQNTHPVWSPDASKIAYINNRVGVENGNPVNFEVFTMNSDGTNVKRHTNNTAFEAEISWSPDGNKLAFKSYRDGNDEIYLLNLSTNEQMNVSNHPSRDDSPVWSNDGESIIFQSERDSTVGPMFAYTISSKEIISLNIDLFGGYGATWSPNGEKIAFISNKDGDDDIYIMDSSGENLLQLTNNPLNDWYPRWSPDGESILYTYGDWNTDVWELRIISSDGTGDRTIVSGTDSGNASWHPSGGRIAFGSAKEGKGEIYVYDLRDKSETQITKSK